MSGIIANAEATLIWHLVMFNGQRPALFRVYQNHIEILKNDKQVGDIQKVNSILNSQ